MKNIYITDCNHGFLDPEIDSVKGTDFSVHFLNLNETTPQKEVIEKCKDADIIATQRVHINADMASNFEKCKVIARYGVGVDNLEVDALQDMGISIVNFPTFCTEEVANHATSLILFLYRKLNAIFGMNDFTDHWGRPNFIRDIKSSENTTVGIIGLGRIGSEVEKRLLACNFNVKYYDPYIGQSEKASSSLEEIFSESDIITVHCPLNEETEGMINKELFEIDKDLLLVNTARGRIINQTDLENHLSQNPKSAACLDVCDPEPAAYSSYQLSNLYITPHVAFYSKHSLHRLKNQVITESIKAYNENIRRTS